jgi:4-amino-4-deoxy-L-arabinose transferase-like glycosyltransferase
MESRTWVLVFLSVLLFFPMLGARDFWAPVEPRYAEIARVMLAKNAWIVPTINGGLYSDKPILYFWLVLILSKLAGHVNEWTLRLPSALSAVGLVVTTYLFGRDLFSPRVGLLAATILATSARVLWEGRWARTDMAFTFFFTLSLYFFSKTALKEGSPKDGYLAYGLMGLATLTKGLIGIVLPGLILLAFVAAKGLWSDLKKWRLPSGISIFLLVTAPWFVMVGLATDGKWPEDFVFIHHIQRYTSGLGHREPFYYYLVNFPADFLPWTIFLIPAIFAYRPRIKLLKEPVPLFLFLWFFVVLLFFSLSNTKRALYLLPIFAPAAIFLACYFDNLASGEMRPGAVYQWSAHLFFNLLWIVSLSLPVVLWFFRREAVWTSLPFSLVSGVGGLMTALWIKRRLPSMVFLSTASTALLGMLCAVAWILPFIDQYKSPRPFALLVKKSVPSNEPLYIYADTMNDFNFYTEREAIPVISSESHLEGMIPQGKTAYMLIRDRDLKKLSLKANAAVLATDRIGDKQWVLMKLSG